MINPVVVFSGIAAVLGAVVAWFGMSIVRRSSVEETDLSLLRRVRWLGAVILLLMWGLLSLARFIVSNAGSELTPREVNAYDAAPFAFLLAAALVGLISLLVENTSRKRRIESFKEERFVANALGSKGAQNQLPIPPLPKTFYAKPTPILRMILVCLRFIGLSISYWSTQHTRAVIYAGCGILGLAIIPVLHFSARRFLKLTEDGFTVSRPQGATTYAFSDIDRFDIYTRGAKKRVSWRYQPDSALHQGKITRRLTGADGILGGDFEGITNDELYTLLNRMLAISQQKLERRRQFHE